MIAVNLLTSGKHTRLVIEALKKAAGVKLLGIHPNLANFSASISGANKKPVGDVLLVADFGEIIDAATLKLAKSGSLCLHPSLLPKYRGASPVQYAIMNGEKETGLTILKMDEKVDHGPIIYQLKEPIRKDDNAETLYQRLFTAGAGALQDILPSWIEGKIKPRPQDHSQATYTRRLRREDGRIDWQKSDQEIDRFIRAMTAWPGAYTLLRSSSFAGQTKRLKILKAHLEPSIPDRPLSPIGGRESRESRNLVFDLVQLEGKKPISWKQFLAGHHVKKFV